ncbi:unnamed protein product [Rotaria sordida]|uniref:G-protein coupled receptors family 1 profile domain-containing protein n=1 Tax=Rotaria sordida TaxID=392033 RepID=A0A813W8R6_9BILA|nr:unnamed protein product [Rotaria sordida]CAF1011832.1 unnamed protein product [Rotaria sordida]CAF3677623.1 unnamed protein product [Rotaria sordida]
MSLIWFIGNFGSTINCFIFYQPNLRKNPCVMYLLASSASQFLTFNFALLTRILYMGFNIQAVNTFLWYCKIRFYFFYISVAIPRYYIILASIDRYFTSSPDIYWRRWSSSKIAMRLIIGSCLFWCLIYIQVLIFYEIQKNGCSFRNGIYGIIFSVYLLIESGILPPLMMLIFECLTLNNIRQSKRKTRSLTVGDVVRPGQYTRMSRKDLQFSKMLFNQICLWIILNIPNPCYLLYQTITINDTKSPLRLTVESFISNMSYLFIYLEFSLTFFVYTLSSSLFRREFNRLIRHKILPRFPSNTTLRNNT